MKCLLCEYNDNKKDNLKRHYVICHNVDENNLFFQKMINGKSNGIYNRRCGYCNEFVVANKQTHNFLKHYGKGLSINDNDNNDDDIDDKPVDIVNTPGLKKIEISFKQHSSFYDFFDSVALVDSFLAQVKDIMKRNDNKVLIRAGFCIENIQQPLDGYSDPLTSNRYWSTEPLQTNYLNDFILFKVRDSILKRVIVNRESGSAWNFNKFNYINVKILDASYRLMR